MEKIQHKTIAVNGINLHVAEIGEGPAVLFIHGFPELWYTWRHQMLSLSSLGYRAIAPDLRGYGDSDSPSSVASYTAFHVVGDLVGLLDALGLAQVFLVGHDWGAWIAWYVCMFRPDRIKALVNLSVTFQPRNPVVTPLQGMRAALGDDFYICRFQDKGVVARGLERKLIRGFGGCGDFEPGVAEEELARADVSDLMKAILTTCKPRPPIVPKDIGFGAFWEIPATLPPWLTEEDISYFATKFSQKGFSGPLNYYRNIDRNWELTAPWTGAKIQVPVKFIVGNLDLTYSLPGAKEYIHNGGFKEDVPFLEETVVIEGAGHFINQEKPYEITSHIHNFIQKFKN